MLESVQKKVPIRQTKSIVLATDFLESSRLALDYAVAFSHHYGAKLTIVHALELSPEAQEVEVLYRQPSVSREHALARLEALASGVRRVSISAEIDLREGEPCASVICSAADKNADLLVLGTHGIYRGLEHALIGSNAEKILLSAPCPTLTVGRHVLAGIDLDLNFRKILLISDMSPESITAALFAVSLGRDLDIPIEILQISSDNRAVNTHHVSAILEEYCSNLGRLPVFSNHEWCDPAFHLKRMASADEIVQRATKCADCLLILGVRPESGWKRHLHASFAFELVARSTCPLLSIREASV